MSDLKDPLLDALEVRPGVLNLSDNLSPISMKDQILRGTTVADRAYSTRLIDEDRPLAVVGGGAAGVAAALQASHRGVPVTLIERSARLFGRQAGCLTRWIDPTQYDWPMPHWTRGVFPTDGFAVPLAWRASFATGIAAEWRRQFNTAVRDARADFTCVFGTTLTPPTLVAPEGYESTGTYLYSHSARSFLLDALVEDGERSRRERFGPFGLLVVAAGFGDERASFGAYRGPDFWATDQLEEAVAGASGADPRFLVSGGGDGALQDFLRILFPHVPPRSLALRLNLPGRFVARCAAADELYQRAYLWSTPGARDHEIEQTLHREFSSAVDELAFNPDYARHWDAIEARFDRFARTPLPDLTLSVPCTHFSRSYALNRALVLMAARWLERRRDISPIRYSSSLLGVSAGAGHACAPAATCFGLEHRATFARATCFERETRESAASEFDVIVIRHGIDPASSRDLLGRASTLRQMTPYYSSFRD